MQRLRHLVTALVLLWLAVPAVAQALAPDVARLPQGPLALSAHLAYHEDPHHQLRPEDLLDPARAWSVPTASAPATDLRFGHTSSAYWFRLPVRNSAPSARSAILELAYAPLSRVELYRVAEGRIERVAQAGAAVPFDGRPVAFRNPAFLLDLPGGAEVRYVLRVTAISALIVPARLWTPAAFAAHAQQDLAVQGVYFGMVAAIAVFNLLLFASLRETAYLTYAGYLGLLAGAIATQMGLAQQYLWPQASDWPDRINYALFSLTLGVFVHFMQRMLDTRRVLGAWNRAPTVVSILLLVSAPALGLLLPWGAHWALVLYMLTVILVLVIAVACAWQGQRTARFFVAAYAAVFAGALVVALRGLGWLPTNALTVHALQLGSALEMLLLAFALADRFIRLKDEVVQVQAALLESHHQTAEAQAQAIRTLKESERELERRVKERTDQLEALNAHLEKVSRTDALTGIANRRQFDETLATEFSRAVRTAQPLGLALLDVDWFKAYNDRYGHQAGDECLKVIAAQLATHVARAGDLVARYGGEEFAFIVPNTGPEAARAMAQRVCDAVHEKNLAHPDSPLGRVSVSLGLMAAVPDAAATAEQWLHHADQALYAAKHAGRNRVESVPDRGLHGAMPED